ncbi:MAG: glycosyltransferase family 2 protein [Methanobacteriaceae archaeon]|jgi:glycosyltransferase involved in cell wall biosynthesis|nr:glycosyltransferase family 2 protein [Methanobacteriaceae archaeon]OPY24616.1 MAG: putative glycosyl transferase [Methanobacterium sp. PtaU1.Bin097]
MDKLPVSVLVHTLNEEKNIRNCLETVEWADEIIIVDMYSDDKTTEIASEYTDKIFYHERMGYADPARQFGLEKASNNWILILDADELVPLKLKKRLENIIEEDLGDIISIPRNNYFFGKVMRHTGWGPLQDTLHRFFKKEYVFITDKIHSLLVEREDARIYEITHEDEGIIHFNYVDVEHFLEKLNRYTTIEAKALYEADEDIRFRSVVNQILGEFRNRYFKLQGRKEGFRGFSLGFLMGTYRLVTYAKLKLMKEYHSENPSSEIEKEYNRVALEIRSEYEE